jgi:nucleotide-binding universal stress UspA family protein
VAVAEPPSTFDLSAPVDLVTPLADAADEQLAAVLPALRARHPGVEGLVRVGVPWEQILAAAAEVSAELVVVGTHGRRGLAHVVLGSVAERVVQLSPVPVLTVRAR